MKQGHITATITTGIVNDWITFTPFDGDTLHFDAEQARALAHNMLELADIFESLVKE